MTGRVQVVSTVVRKGASAPPPPARDPQSLASSLVPAQGATDKQIARAVEAALPVVQAWLEKHPSEQAKLASAFESAVAGLPLGTLKMMHPRLQSVPVLAAALTRAIAQREARTDRVDDAAAPKTDAKQGRPALRSGKVISDKPSYEELSKTLEDLHASYEQTRDPSLLEDIHTIAPMLQRAIEQQAKSIETLPADQRDAAYAVIQTAQDRLLGLVDQAELARIRTLELSPADRRAGHLSPGVITDAVLAGIDAQAAGERVPPKGVDARAFHWGRAMALQGISRADIESFLLTGDKTEAMLTVEARAQGSGEWTVQNALTGVRHLEDALLRSHRYALEKDRQAPGADVKAIDAESAKLDANLKAGRGYVNQLAWNGSKKRIEHAEHTLDTAQRRDYEAARMEAVAAKEKDPVKAAALRDKAKRARGEASRARELAKREARSERTYLAGKADRLAAKGRAVSPWLQHQTGRAFRAEVSVKNEIARVEIAEAKKSGTVLTRPPTALASNEVSLRADAPLHAPMPGEEPSQAWLIAEAERYDPASKGSQEGLAVRQEYAAVAAEYYDAKLRKNGYFVAVDGRELINPNASVDDALNRMTYWNWRDAQQETIDKRIAQLGDPKALAPGTAQLYSALNESSGAISDERALALTASATLHAQLDSLRAQEKELVEEAKEAGTKHQDLGGKTRIEWLEHETTRELSASEMFAQAYARPDQKAQLVQAKERLKDNPIELQKVRVEIAKLKAYETKMLGDAMLADNNAYLDWQNTPASIDKHIGAADRAYTRSVDAAKREHALLVQKNAKPEDLAAAKERVFLANAAVAQHHSLSAQWLRSIGSPKPKDALAIADRAKRAISAAQEVQSYTPADPKDKDAIASGQVDLMIAVGATFYPNELVLAGRLITDARTISEAISDAELRKHAQDHTAKAAVGALDSLEQNAYEAAASASFDLNYPNDMLDNARKWQRDISDPIDAEAAKEKIARLDHLLDVAIPSVLDEAAAQAKNSHDASVHAAKQSKRDATRAIDDSVNGLGQIGSRAVGVFVGSWEGGHEGRLGREYDAFVKDDNARVAQETYVEGIEALANVYAAAKRQSRGTDIRLGVLIALKAAAAPNSVRVPGFDRAEAQLREVMNQAAGRKAISDHEAKIGNVLLALRNPRHHTLDEEVAKQDPASAKAPPELELPMLSMWLHGPSFDPRPAQKALGGTQRIFRTAAQRTAEISANTWTKHFTTSDRNRALSVAGTIAELAAFSVASELAAVRIIATSKNLFTLARGFSAVQRTVSAVNTSRRVLSAVNLMRAAGVTRALGAGARAAKWTVGIGVKNAGTMGKLFTGTRQMLAISYASMKGEEWATKHFGPGTPGAEIAHVIFSMAPIGGANNVAGISSKLAKVAKWGKVIGYSRHLGAQVGLPVGMWALSAYGVPKAFVLLGRDPNQHAFALEMTNLAVGALVPSAIGAWGSRRTQVEAHRAARDFYNESTGAKLEGKALEAAQRRLGEQIFAFHDQYATRVPTQTERAALVTEIAASIGGGRHEHVAAEKVIHALSAEKAVQQALEHKDVAIEPSKAPTRRELGRALELSTKTLEDAGFDPKDARHLAAQEVSKVFGGMANAKRRDPAVAKAFEALASEARERADATAFVHMETATAEKFPPGADKAKAEQIVGDALGALRRASEGGEPLTDTFLLDLRDKLKAAGIGEGAVADALAAEVLARGRSNALSKTHMQLWHTTGGKVSEDAMRIALSEVVKRLGTTDPAMIAKQIDGTMGFFRTLKAIDAGGVRSRVPREQEQVGNSDLPQGPAASAADAPPPTRLPEKARAEAFRDPTKRQALAEIEKLGDEGVAAAAVEVLARESDPRRIAFLELAVGMGPRATDIGVALLQRYPKLEDIPDVELRFMRSTVPPGLPAHTYTGARKFEYERLWGSGGQESRPVLERIAEWSQSGDPLRRHVAGVMLDQLGSADPARIPQLTRAMDDAVAWKPLAEARAGAQKVDDALPAQLALRLSEAPGTLIVAYERRIMRADNPTAELTDIDVETQFAQFEVGVGVRPDKESQVLERLQANAQANPEGKPVIVLAPNMAVDSKRSMELKHHKIYVVRSIEDALRVHAQLRAEAQKKTSTAVALEGKSPGALLGDRARGDGELLGPWRSIAERKSESSPAMRQLADRLRTSIDFEAMRASRPRDPLKDGLADLPAHELMSKQMREVRSLLGALERAGFGPALQEVFARVTDPKRRGQILGLLLHARTVGNVRSILHWGVMKGPGARQDVRQRNEAELRTNLEHHVRRIAGGEPTVHASAGAFTVDVSGGQIRIEIRGRDIAVNVGGADAQKLQQAAEAFVRANFSGSEPPYTLRGSPIAPPQVKPGPGVVRGGFDTSKVLGTDRATGRVLVEVNGEPKLMPLHALITEHPGLVHGLVVVVNGQRVIVAPSHTPGELTLFPQDPNIKLKDLGTPPRMRAEELVKRFPAEIAAAVSPPSIRVRTVEVVETLVDGTLITEPAVVEKHGYTMLGIDDANGVAVVRNERGDIERVPLHDVVYEHNGSAVGSLSPVSEERYQARLEALWGSDPAVPSAELRAFSALRARAEDISPAHGAIAKLLLADGELTVGEIADFIDRIAHVAPDQVGKWVSMQGHQQHFTDSCVAACMLHGAGLLDPSLAAAITANPGFSARRQQRYMLGNDGRRAPRSDPQYAHMYFDPTTPAMYDYAKTRPLGDGLQAIDPTAVDPPRAMTQLTDPKQLGPKGVVLHTNGGAVRLFSERGKLTIEVGNKRQAFKAEDLLAGKLDVDGPSGLHLRVGTKIFTLSEIVAPASMRFIAKGRGVLHTPQMFQLIAHYYGEPYREHRIDNTSDQDLETAIASAVREGKHVPLTVAGVRADHQGEVHEKMGLHQLWISERRPNQSSKPGQYEFLVYDPMSGPRWLTIGEVRNYQAKETHKYVLFTAMLPESIKPPPGSRFYLDQASAAHHGQLGAVEAFVGGVPPGITHPPPSKFQGREQEAFARRWQLADINEKTVLLSAAQHKDRKLASDLLTWLDTHPEPRHIAEIDGALHEGRGREALDAILIAKSSKVIYQPIPAAQIVLVRRATLIPDAAFQKEVIAFAGRASEPAARMVTDALELGHDHARAIMAAIAAGKIDPTHFTADQLSAAFRNAGVKPPGALQRIADWLSGRMRLTPERAARAMTTISTLPEPVRKQMLERFRSLPNETSRAAYLGATDTLRATLQADLPLLDAGAQVLSPRELMIAAERITTARVHGYGAVLDRIAHLPSDTARATALRVLIAGSPLEVALNSLRNAYDGATPPARISADESRNILSAAKVAPQWAGKPAISTEQLQRAGLEPKYRTTIDGTHVTLSSAFSIGGGRRAVLAYVEIDGQTYVRFMYRSNSQTSWRLMEAKLPGLYGKGHAETDLQVPLALSGHLEKLAHADMIDLRHPDTGERASIDTEGGTSDAASRVMTGVVETADFLSKKVGGYERHWSKEYDAAVNKEPVPFSIHDERARLSSYKARELGMAGLQADPKKVRLPPKEYLPNFSREIDTYTMHSAAYARLNGGNGTLTMHVYLSNDGKSKYLFVEDSAGRVAVAAVENLGAKMTRFGVRERYYELDGTNAPLMEYEVQVPDKPPYHGGPMLDYMLNWNYVREQPIIQHFYKANKREMPPLLSEEQLRRKS